MPMSVACKNHIVSFIHAYDTKINLNTYDLADSNCTCVGGVFKCQCDSRAFPLLGLGS